MIIRIVLAVILGGLIGIERGVRNHPAGFRTHILVCVGACLAMITNEYVAGAIGSVADPTRMGAQVISGIGFLGVGTIFMTGAGTVRGLTTAAGLWASACVGLAIGIGFYLGGIATAVIVIIVLGLLPKLEDVIYRRSRRLRIFIEMRSMYVVKDVTDYIEDQGNVIKTKDINSISNKDNLVSIYLSVQLTKGADPDTLVEEVATLDGVLLIDVQ
ncbi:MAG: MgtC/SapB family protein [Clostridiales Family XIII bacterium]|nr:MgtC/SapB family protein [Clostridiales Family XIII bacterium]